MATRMMHPVHGFTHAYNNNDIAYLEKLGWSVEPNAETVAAMTEADEIVIRKAYFDKFGKKPHHMAKLETIKKALDDNS